MRLNTGKSKIISWNFTKRDFIPRMYLNDVELDVTYSTKLLGVICSSSGKWNEHIQYLVRKSNTRLYFIRRLKKLGASNLTLTEAFTLFVRPILEMCAPLWTGALFLRTGKLLSESLERVQKAFCKILLPQKDYFAALEILGL